MIAVLHIVTLFKLFQVRRADIEWYTGEDELPPYCEMTLRAAGAEGQRGDLRFGAILKETEISPIMIERTYTVKTQVGPSHQKWDFCITFTPKVMQKSHFWCDGPTCVFTVYEQKTGRFQRWSTKTRNSKIASDEVLAS